MTEKPEKAAHYGWLAVPPGSTAWRPSHGVGRRRSADLSSKPTTKGGTIPCSPSRFLLAQLGGVDPALDRDARGTEFVALLERATRPDRDAPGQRWKR
jgi:hypothetical protein